MKGACRYALGVKSWWVEFLDGERKGTLCLSPPSALSIPLAFCAHTSPPQSVQVLPNNLTESRIRLFDLLIGRGMSRAWGCAQSHSLRRLLPIVHVIMLACPGLHQGVKTGAGP